MFDVIVTRPTNVYGLSSSFYGLIFKFAEDAKKKGVWELDEHPNTILHVMHVDDCDEAYVALAEAGRRDGIIISLPGSGRRFGMLQMPSRTSMVLKVV